MARKVAKTATLWHAFEALRQPGSDTVPKAKLKVLTQNIGSSIGLVNIEEKLDGHGSSTLTFSSYLGFMQSEIFGNIHQTALPGRRPSCLEKINEVCWLLCCHGYGNRKPLVLDLDDLFLLWKIFNTLVEYDSEGLMTPVVVDCEEMVIFVKEFCRLAGIRCDADELDEISRDTKQFSFREFAQFIESKLCRDVSISSATIRSVLGNLQNEYVFEVMKKGMLMKRGQKAKTLKERWFVLTPAVLRYYTGPDERELKGEIIVNPHWKIQVLSDAEKGNYRCKLKLSTHKRELEILAADLKTRGDWQTAIMSAVDHCRKPMAPREFQRETRRVERTHRRMQLERTREQLEQHRKHCKAAEERVNKIMALRQEDQQQLAELWKLKQKLEILLEDERRAREDEQTSRHQQEKVLLEEEVRRRNLERIQKQLEQDLATERQQRESQQELLGEEQQKLEQLQRERARIDRDLREKKMKLEEAEKAKETLQKKFNKKDLYKSQKIAELAAHLPDADELKLIESHRGLGAFYWDERETGADWCGYELVKEPEIDQHDSGTDSGRSSDDSGSAHLP